MAHTVSTAALLTSSSRLITNIIVFHPCINLKCPCQPFTAQCVFMRMFCLVLSTQREMHYYSSGFLILFFFFFCFYLLSQKHVWCHFTVQKRLNLLMKDAVSFTGDTESFHSSFITHKLRLWCNKISLRYSHRKKKKKMNHFNRRKVIEEEGIWKECFQKKTRSRAFAL